MLLRIVTILAIINFYPIFNNSFTCVKAQSIEELMAEVDSNHLIKTVREFSGEDSTLLYGNQVLIRHRISSKGNDTAAYYITEKLRDLELNFETDTYSIKGLNILATQIGQTYPNSIYLIGAHYDAVARYCADDNASGVATILETARILSKQCFDYTIMYAFWDEEELGLVGSKNYANNLASNETNIAGVINLDMLAYDSNNDGIFDIHTQADTASLYLKDKVLSVLYHHNLNLTANIFNPGTTRSDHASFWSNNIPAVMFGESFFGGDANHAYHSIDDRIELFNIPYYTELTKLTLGTLASLASPCYQISLNSNGHNQQSRFQVYPNPTSSSLIVSSSINKPYRILFTNFLGQIVLQEVTHKNQKEIKTNHLPNGLYRVSVLNGKKTSYKIILIQH